MKCQCILEYTLSSSTSVRSLLSSLFRKILLYILNIIYSCALITALRRRMRCPSLTHRPCCAWRERNKGLLCAREYTLEYSLSVLCWSLTNYKLRTGYMQVPNIGFPQWERRVCFRQNRRKSNIFYVSNHGIPFQKTEKLHEGAVCYSLKLV